MSNVILRLLVRLALVGHENNKLTVFSILY